jgi:hypothetical protein
LFGDGCVMAEIGNSVIAMRWVTECDRWMGRGGCDWLGEEELGFSGVVCFGKLIHHAEN